jgi:hypothetical protein
MRQNFSGAKKQKKATPDANQKERKGVANKWVKLHESPGPNQNAYMTQAPYTRRKNKSPKNKKERRRCTRVSHFPMKCNWVLFLCLIEPHLATRVALACVESRVNSASF